MTTPTPQQDAAISSRGNVLVAAGAGTGKTSTVTARCIDLVIKDGCRLDQLLMVTFTEAAAAEMRERIREALRERSAMERTDSDSATHINEQIALLDTAPISTLHSFCLDLVHRNFHTLELDPQFSVLDEQQTKPLIHAVLDELFARHYANAGGNSLHVRDLIRTYGNGRDDAIRELVVSIHRHTQALESPSKWFEQQMASFNDSSPEAWRELFVAGVIQWAELWRETIEPYAQGSGNVRACANVIDSLFQEQKFEAAAKTVTAIVEAHEMKWDKLKKDFRDPIKPFFTEAAFLSELAQDNGTPLAQDWSWVRGHMLTLLQLAREFSKDFTDAKRELGGIDFADQEQLALRLLHGDDGQLTPVALACRERFRFVFVDECQDINAAQDAILRAVSGEGTQANRFLVGDVKQSIYRFRLADPRIFQDYAETWADKVGRVTPCAPPVTKSNSGAHGVTRPTSSGRALPLSENFRSREGLLKLINPLFRTLMKPVIGGLNYDADAELQFGNPTVRAALSLAVRTKPIPNPSQEGSEQENARNQFPFGEGSGVGSSATPEVLLEAGEMSPRVELHVITKEGESDASDETGEGGGRASELADLQSTEREARLVAQQLRKLEEGRHQIWDKDKKCFRAVKWSDMVVLMRGVAGRAEIFAKTFHQAGVPLHAERAGFLNAIEITDLLNLLRLLDNPLQDVPLLAVLRSPLAGFSAEELVQLRLAHRNGLLWPALRVLSKSNEPASAKAAVFLKQYARWRELVRHSSLSHCLETALAETHYEALLLAGERGDARVANVRRLVELARRFDPHQREGLFRFLRFIAEQEEAGVRHEPAALNAENAVRLMSIHASKGLEFPVVVVAGLGGRFNLRDLSRDVLLNEDLGLCPKVLAPESRRRYPSIAHWVAAQRERRAALGEEMRLLYVAVTRARDTLILTGTATRKDEAARWKQAAPVTDLALVKVLNCLDWLRLWFVNWAQPEDWKDDSEGANQLLRWRFHDPHDAGLLLQDTSEDYLAVGNQTPPTADELDLIRQRTTTSYPHAAATIESAKTSVSVLRRRAIETDEDAVPAFKFQRKGTYSTVPGALSAAERGIAHHSFMQLSSLERTSTELDLRNEANRLTEAGALTTEQTASLDFKALANFWLSDLGQRLRHQPANSVHREMPFTARMNAGDLRRLKLSPSDSRLADDEFVVVQGVVDLAVITPEEIWIVDFKTDELRTEDMEAKASLYEPQLKLYALALSRIYGRPVTECWLHFLRAGRTVNVDR